MTNYYITEDNTEQGRIIEYSISIAPHWGDRYFSTEENLVIVSNGESGDTIVKQS
jgi:hypothetical protein